MKTLALSLLSLIVFAPAQLQALTIGGMGQHLERSYHSTMVSNIKAFMKKHSMGNPSDYNGGMYRTSLPAGKPYINKAGKRADVPKEWDSNLIVRLDPKRGSSSIYFIVNGYGNVLGMYR